MCLEDKALPQWTQINSMTSLGKGHHVEKQILRKFTVAGSFWDSATGMGDDAQEWKLTTFQT